MCLGTRIYTGNTKARYYNIQRSNVAFYCLEMTTLWYGIARGITIMVTSPSVVSSFRFVRQSVTSSTLLRKVNELTAGVEARKNCYCNSFGFNDVECFLLLTGLIKANGVILIVMRSFRDMRPQTNGNYNA